MENKKIILKPLIKKTWSGFHRFPKCTDTVIASIGRGGYITGLSEEESEALEKELNYPKGMLSKNSPFWKDYAVIITEPEIHLDLSIARDRLDYAILKGSKKVATSMREYNEGKYPKAKYVIHDIEEEAKIENVKVLAKKRAWKKLATMSITEMKQVLKLMGKKADNTKDEIVENTLATIIESNPDEFNKIIEIDNFKTRLLIEDLLSKNLLRKMGSKYLYGDDVIGYNLDEALQYLIDPKNQEILITLQEKLNSKSKPAK